jgi:DNA-binding NtrC family response regulator
MATVVYFVKDLMFSSKIREVASQVGTDVEPFRDPAQLAAAAKSAKLVIVDLRVPEAMRALELIAADPASREVMTVGFIDHEKVDVMDEATKKGCKKVFAKGQFSNQLVHLMADVVQTP